MSDWLNEFNDAKSKTNSAIWVAQSLSRTINAAGLSIGRDILDELIIIQASIGEMADAISKMIHEEFVASQEEVGHTLIALLNMGDKQNTEVKGK